MKRNLFLILLLTIAYCSSAQELFSVTEPASNKPARSITFRIDNSLMDEINTSKTNYHLVPEVMAGLGKKLMISANAFFSNRRDEMGLEGGSLYAKYRFLSNDAMQRHFRMAFFGRVSTNNSDIHQEEININSHNSGMELGVVATQLLKKVAISSSVSFIKATDNVDNKFIYGSANSKACNFTLSAGKLMLPREYKNYQQTNVNLMIELLGQVNTGNGKYYLDIAPSIQMIVNSQSRLDVGYRKEIGTSLIRTAPNGVFIRFEHVLFNVF